MAMVYSSLFSSSLTLLSPLKQSKGFTSLQPHLSTIQCSINNSNNSRRDFPVPSVAASITYPPINVNYLETEFSGHGVTFEDLSDSCIVKMVLDNGSAVTLMLPSGLITSYKAPMWHGGMLELLQTCVSEDEDNGEAVIKGGMSLAFKFEREDDVSWSPTQWALLDVRGDPQESVEVELVCSDSQDKVKVRQIVTLKQDLLISELLISNPNQSSLRLRGCLSSHLTVSTPDATYALGLERSDYRNTPPFLSNFSITPPKSSDEQDWGEFSDFFSKWVASPNQNKAKSRRENEEEMDGEEADNYKHLTDEMSKIYTNAPRSFTILDRGRRNSIIVGRQGFDEMYMFSPGSSHKWYGKYAYITVGQSAMLQPIVIGPEAEWRGSQQLHNPNS